MFPIKMKMNCSSGSPVVALLLFVSLNLCHTDRSLSTKGCSGPAVAAQPEHITSLSENAVCAVRQRSRRVVQGEVVVVEVLNIHNSSVLKKNMLH